MKDPCTTGVHQALYYMGLFYVLSITAESAFVHETTILLRSFCVTRPVVVY